MSVRKPRELRPDDDFVGINGLLRDTWLRVAQGIGSKTGYCGRPEDLRRTFFGEGPRASAGSRRGFVVEESGRAVAFMAVALRGNGDGAVEMGFEAAAEGHLADLAQCCRGVVSGVGGKRLLAVSAMRAGQIRNPAPSFLEGLGFVPDEHFHAIISMDLASWRGPDMPAPEGMEPAAEAERQALPSVLWAAGDEYLSEYFQGELTAPTIDCVAVSLRRGTETVAMAHYGLARFQDGPYDGLGAWETGFHFWPALGIERGEKRRFIEAVLSSMKQREVVFASAVVSSRDFDAFAELLNQGFYFQGGDRQLIVRFTQSV